jgi:ArsR family transcriptional regulator
MPKLSPASASITATLALLKAAGDRDRLRLLRLVDRAELSVGDLVEATGLSQPSVSRHLAALRATGVVSERHDGPRSMSRIVDPLPDALGPLMAVLRAVYGGQDFGDGADLDRLQTILARRKAQRAERFDLLAADWDELRALILGGALSAGEVCSLLAPAGGRWVDVGTGTGLLLPWLSALAGPQGQVLAIEAAEGMAERARERVRSLGLENVRVLSGDMARLPIDDQCVDGLVFSLALGQAEDCDLALAEAARVLLPGGRLVVADVERHGHDDLVSALGPGFRGFALDALESRILRAGFTALRRMPSHAVHPSNSSRTADLPRLEPILLGAIRAPA